MVTVGARGATAIVGTVAVAVQTTAGLATALARTLHDYQPATHWTLFRAMTTLMLVKMQT